ncbi:hypothetical protein EBR03_03175 [bacterium]|nr:hypothetical protein [bacterium]
MPFFEAYSRCYQKKTFFSLRQLRRSCHNCLSRIGLVKCENVSFCELDKMDWIVQVFLKDKNGRIWALRYRLTTSD